MSTRASKMPRIPEYEQLMQLRTRWLMKNDIQMAVRHLDFDVEALAKAAAKAGGGACAKEIEEIGEGSYNKLYRFGLENGNDVVARIPFSNAGPRGLLTRSEVATMDFLRHHFGALIPKILSWEATSDNEVGCEYILMEKCSGKTLEHADQVSRQTIFDLANFQNKLGSIRFSSFGSIFYKEDVDSELQERPLYADTMPQDACSERFRIGPCVDRDFYRAERRHLVIDRGPWTDISSYIRAVAECEIKWIEGYSDTPDAKGQLGVYRSPAAHIKRLREWIDLAPKILPSTDLCTPTLSHPDLHPGNIFVDGKEHCSLSSIIDWQGATVRSFFETDIMNFRELEVLGEDGISPSDIYTATIEEHHPMLQSLTPPHIDSLRCLVYASAYCWYLGLVPFEDRLLTLGILHGDAWPSGVPDPRGLASKAELQDTENTRSRIKVHEVMDRYARQKLGKRGIMVNPDGSVPELQYEDALEATKEVYAGGLKAVKSNADRYPEVWPFRESRSVLTMESCVD